MITRKLFRSVFGKVGPSQNVQSSRTSVESTAAVSLSEMKLLKRRTSPLQWGIMACLASVIVGACATNPVTGKNELLIVGEDWELDVGRKNYAPLRQAQGGDYVVDPAVEIYVRQVGQKLAAHSDRELPYEFHVINDSTPNAWALPGGKISINRGLLVELGNEAELAAVLGHEIVHAAAKHGARGQTRGAFLQGAAVAATIAGARNGYGQAAQTVATLGAHLTNSKYGRDAELESDLYGMRYMSEAGYDPQGAVDLQKTFVRLSQGNNPDFISGLFATHPPSLTRVKTNIETAKALPQGGDLGEARYRSAMRTLLRTQPAYKVLDEATAALQAGNTAQARSLAQKAIRMEPKEGHFYSFLGDIERTTGNTRAAKSLFDKAISLNRNFYYYHVRRGEVHQQTGNQSAAKVDFENSMRLLPTAEAQFGLGQIAQATGNTSQAREYYAQAAQLGGAVGEKATKALETMGGSSVAAASPNASNSSTAASRQAAANRQSALIVNKGLSQSGTFAIQVINKTSRPMTNIVLRLSGVGNLKPYAQKIDGTLGAGRAQFLDTGQRMTRAQANAIQVSVLDFTAR